jgi:hypothetical protein
MRPSSWFIVLLAGTLMIPNGSSIPSSDLFEVDVRQLAEVWATERVSPPDPYTLRHAELKRRLTDLATRHAGFFSLQEAGRSVEGREIFLASIGRGSEKILFWSQMHGDEPTATSSLLDLFEFLARHRDDGWVSAILTKYRLLFMPMLNPDGAERGRRRNAQGIDINRDARALETPEGRLLKAVRDRHRPFLGFNLHNQNGTTTVGDTGKVATIALLAVAVDAPPEKATHDAAAPRNTLLAKQVTAVLYEALAPFVYGHISRYDESYNPRAFGDNMTLWGTPVVLVESGGNPAGEPADFGVRLNFVGLLAALNSLASGRIERANPAVFDALKMNSEDPIYDLMLRGAWIFTGSGVPLFRGDIAIRHDARAGSTAESIVGDVGDLGVFSAHETIDCSNVLVTPGLIAWNPDGSPSAGSKKDPDWLRKGVTTLLETVELEVVSGGKGVPEQLQGQQRPINWGFVVAGRPASVNRDSDLRLAEWLAAGGRAWIVDGGESSGDSTADRIPGWFRTEKMAAVDAGRYRLPAVFEGDPAQSLVQWTGEAARRFRLARRGIVETGAVADLVLWTSSESQTPKDLRQWKPSRVILNGRLVDLSSGPLPPIGRFLGR